MVKKLKKKNKHTNNNWEKIRLGTWKLAMKRKNMKHSLRDISKLALVIYEIKLNNHLKNFTALVLVTEIILN